MNKNRTCYGASISKKMMDEFIADSSAVKLSNIDNNIMVEIAIPHYEKMKRLQYECIDGLLLLTIFYNGMSYSRYAMLYLLTENGPELLMQEVLVSSSVSKSIMLLPQKHIIVDNTNDGDVKIFQYRKPAGCMLDMYPKLTIMDAINFHTSDMILVSVSYDMIDFSGSGKQGMNKYVIKLVEGRLPMVLYDERENGSFDYIVDSNDNPKFVAVNNAIFGIHTNSRGIETLTALVVENNKITIAPVVNEFLQPIGDGIENIYPGAIFPKIDMLIPANEMCEDDGVIKHTSTSGSIFIEHGDGTMYSLEYSKLNNQFIATEEKMFGFLENS